MAANMGPVLEGKVAVITGAGRGVGAKMGEIFVEAGAKVTLVARSAEVEEVAHRICQAGGEAIAVRADISDPDSVEQLRKAHFDKWGTVDVLINNAANAKLRDTQSADVESDFQSPIEDMLLSEFQESMKVQVYGSFNCAHSFVPEMKRKKWGRIVNFLSFVIHRPMTPQVHYISSKMGLFGLTRGLALELAPYNITVNSLTPGYISTELMVNWAKAKASEAGKDIDVFMSEVAVNIPLRRFTPPEDCANAALFLSSEFARNITGVELPVDGGVSTLS